MSSYMYGHVIQSCFLSKFQKFNILFFVFVIISRLMELYLMKKNYSYTVHSKCGSHEDCIDRVVGHCITIAVMNKVHM